MNCTIYDLGCVAYPEAYRLQMKKVEQRLQGVIGDSLLLLEHPPTITIGTSGQTDDILISRKTLMEKGIQVYFSDRGGKVTYHEPGQLVVYPIINIREVEGDLHRFVWQLEETVIRSAKSLGIDVARDKNHRGVWFNNAKVAAIGLSINKGITMHGLAININNDMTAFSYINPCGFTDRKSVSLSNILKESVSIDTFKRLIVENFSVVFGFQINHQT